MSEQNELIEKNRQIRHLLHPPVNEHEAARILGVAVQTVRNWRHMCRGPAYLKIGRRVAYLTEDLAAYRAERRIEPQAV